MVEYLLIEHDPVSRSGSSHMLVQRWVIGLVLNNPETIGHLLAQDGNQFLGGSWPVGPGGTEKCDIPVGEMTEGIKEGRDQELVWSGSCDITKDNGHCMSGF